MKKHIQSLLNQTTGNGLRAQLIRGGLGSAGVQAINRLLTLALSILLARSLGAEGYGIYAYAFAIMSLLTVLAEAGVPTLLMREVAKSHELLNWKLLHGVLRRGTQFVVITAATVSLLGFLILWHQSGALNSTVSHTLAVMLLLLPVSVLCKTVSYAINGLQRVVVSQVLELFIRPVGALLVVAMVFIMWPDILEPYIAMAAQLFSALIVLLIGARVLRRFLPEESLISSPEYHNREWLNSARAFLLIGGAGIVINQTDLIMLGWFLESKDVGIYRVAVQGAMLITFGFQAVNAVVVPQFSRLYTQGDKGALQRLVKSSTRVILVTSLPLAIVLIFAGAPIISWVFGEDFRVASFPMAILIIGQISLAIVGLSGPLVSMTGMENIISKAMWLSSIVNVVLNLVMIPLFGICGAAIATTVTLLSWHMFLFFLAKKRLGIIVSPFLRA